MNSPQTRTALHQAGGAALQGGAPELSDVLVRAMKEPERVENDTLTHGFHAYAARMHWAIARTILGELAQPKTRVLDPFCGSGTVAIEASVRALEFTGIELNPIALRIAEVKNRRTSRADREMFIDALEKVKGATLDRVRRRAPARAPIPREEVRWYEVHVLKELASLWDEVKRLDDNSVRSAMEMVFSAILVKFSRQQADSTESVRETRVPKGFVTRFFARKGNELARRWEQLAQAVPANVPQVTLIEGDARELPQLLGLNRFDLVVSSPPYGGTYDYLHHHRRRYAWFGIDSEPFARAELGARRRLSQGKGAVARWDRESAAMLTAMREVMSPSARCVLLVGDGEVAGQRIDAFAQLKRLGPRIGLKPMAWASQSRKDWRGGPPRREHLVLLATTDIPG